VQTPPAREALRPSRPLGAPGRARRREEGVRRWRGAHERHTHRTASRQSEGHRVPALRARRWHARDGGHERTRSRCRARRLKPPRARRFRVVGARAAFRHRVGGSRCRRRDEVPRHRVARRARYGKSSLIARLWRRFRITAGALDSNRDRNALEPTGLVANVMGPFALVRNQWGPDGQEPSGTPWRKEWDSVSRLVAADEESNRGSNAGRNRQDNAEDDVCERHGPAMRSHARNQRSWPTLNPSTQ
jgi:hypothetical protein